MDIGSERIAFTPAEMELGGLDQPTYGVDRRTEVADLLRERLGVLLWDAGAAQEVVQRDNSGHAEEGWAERVAKAHTDRCKLNLLVDMIEQLDPQPPIY